MAIIAGTDGAIRPAWLDAWRRWTDLPAVKRDNLFVVDANLLHRAGPRFADGAEALCAVIDRARANATP
jgi:iron complex transport system substrate-binding protein